MIELGTRIRVFTRYLRVYRGRKRSAAMTLQPVCIPLMDVAVCVRVRATHAEDDPLVESRAAVLCGNTRRHLGLSILLPTLRPRPLQPPPDPPSSCSFTLSPTRAILFLFCSSFSSCPLDLARRLSFPLLFRSGFLFLRELACARIEHRVNVFRCTIFVKFLRIENPTLIQVREFSPPCGREKERTRSFRIACDFFKF